MYVEIHELEIKVDLSPVDGKVEAALVRQQDAMNRKMNGSLAYFKMCNAQALDYLREPYITALNELSYDELFEIYKRQNPKKFKGSPLVGLVPVNM